MARFLRCPAPYVRIPLLSTVMMGTHDDHVWGLHDHVGQSAHHEQTKVAVRLCMYVFEYIFLSCILPVKNTNLKCGIVDEPI
jgi:hypothetical protein